MLVDKANSHGVKNKRSNEQIWQSEETKLRHTRFYDRNHKREQTYLQKESNNPQENSKDTFIGSKACWKENVGAESKE